MDNPLTLHNLRSAITYWRSQKRTWNPDFHNSLYIDLARLRSAGLTQSWWSAIVDILWDWRAIRPKSKQYIYERGILRLSDLDFKYGYILNSSQGICPDLETASWSLLAPMYRITYEIKNVYSPVFSSKLCHFILPNAYPVFDLDALGIPIYTYKEYWKICAALWRACSIKQELIAELRHAITDPSSYSQTVDHPQQAPYFPWSTEITELCLTAATILTRS